MPTAERERPLSCRVLSLAQADRQRARAKGRHPTDKARDGYSTGWCRRRGRGEARRTLRLHGQPGVGGHISKLQDGITPLRGGAIQAGSRNRQGSRPGGSAGNSAATLAHQSRHSATGATEQTAVAATPVTPFDFTAGDQNALQLEHKPPDQGSLDIRAAANQLKPDVFWPAQQGSAGQPPRFWPGVMARSQTGPAVEWQTSRSLQGSSQFHHPLSPAWGPIPPPQPPRPGIQKRLATTGHRYRQ